jgi:UDP-glucose 6-dehydrogenase
MAMIFGVIGVGVIGSALLDCAIANGLEIQGFDPNKAWCGPLDKRALGCPIVFVSVPTPTDGDYQNLKALIKVCETLKEMSYPGVVCIRCTVLPGICDMLTEKFGLNIVHMPEFLTEANAKEDFKKQTDLFLSGHPAHVADVYELMCAILGKKIPLHASSDFKVTEFQKYFANCHKAIKVAICNEIYEACKATNTCYDDVQEFAIKVPGVGANHTAVPGPDGQRGYGGACFPKDMQAFSTYLKEGLLFPPGVFAAAIESNDYLRGN